ncbi:class I SAM-dependent methyltransferase [Nocardioides solisilvae]|uniref:class I SAM-dependent methyltransferase n=1 Tax=Nocardioides solisilvae TaxID=1542435 RepID=UPI000D742BD4|nr:class I SAM-dependent methyltransferase [Nocardioides solisilvae]
MRRSLTRAARILTAATAVGTVANGLRLRGRAAGLATLPDAPDAPTDAAVADDWTVVAAHGVTPAPATLAAAVAWADAEGLDAVDLVPGDLPAERALGLLRQVDTRSFRRDPLREGHTAGHALLVRTGLARRAALPGGPLTPAELVGVSRQVKRFAPRSTDLVLAPAERAVALSPSEQLTLERTVLDRYAAGQRAAATTALGVAATGALLAPAVGVPALVAHALQPRLVGVGSGRPAGVRRLLAVLRAPAPPPPVVRLSAELRPLYEKELEQGTERFFEERVDSCRWCGSPDIAPRVTSPDLIQHKPGTFTLDECAACGHVFQNPRLSIEGLDFYYRDFYDGFAGDEMEKVFASSDDEYAGRVGMVAAHATSSPRRWLDVGSGHAHFCLVAKESFPGTSFEGVEQSQAIEDAALRGWVDRAHRGFFPEVADELAGQFDVVSMLHYLEHTREPLAELDAAATALVPGGLLMVEVPDPDCPSGRRLGKWWMPWLQPQHQHFLSMARLEQALEQRGFTVLDRYREPATRGLDVLPAVWFAAGQVVPRPWMPWLPHPTRAQRAARVAVCLAALPVAVVGAVVAQVAAAREQGEPGEQAGNAFRVLARYDVPSGA